MPTQAEESIDAFQQYYRTAHEIEHKASFKQFFWDPVEKKVLGRTGKNWIKIGIFYSVFYAVLTILVAICFFVFNQTIDPRIPKWQLKESLIGTNPGLGFRPHPPEDNVESTLIWYKGSNIENFRHWKESLDTFLSEYKVLGTTTGRGQQFENCGFGVNVQRGAVCNVDISAFAKCTTENFYGYHKSSPCIFLKLNKIFGWEPDCYNDTSNLPDAMSKDLREYIVTEGQKDPQSLNTIWVSCEGENPADIENMGEIEYSPRRGFPGYFYPFMNSEGYLSPLVAVQFLRPQKGVIINIECKAWARNIKHDRKDRIGSVHFEIMID